jgi:3-oxoacyl-[acyl-carrier protein] reductase
MDNNTNEAKVALVTGASRGIGRACAIKLGEKGYKVVVNYNSNEAAAAEVVDAIKAAGSDAVAIKANVSDIADVKRLMKETIASFGQLDVLVNNAGIVKDEFVLMMNPDTIDQCLDLNIKGYLYCTQQAVLKMFSKKKGAIVNVSSVSSKLAVPGQTVYSSTKGAVNAMTATMAKELAPYGIRVNAVAPGFIATDMMDSIPEDKKEEHLANIPLKRFGTAEEVANVVAMLAGEECSYVTGQVIVLDGGLSL